MLAQFSVDGVQCDTALGSKAFLVFVNLFVKALDKMDCYERGTENALK